MTRTDSGGRAPDFLIVGEAKCGTTTLWEMLRIHPSVFFPQDKELHFFSSYVASPQHGRLETHGLAAYLRHFEDARAHQLCGEATPNYLFDEAACGRIRGALGDVRIVAILRDPVERAWSHYWHQVRRGRELLSFERALAAEAERLASGDPDERTHFSYVARGRYVEGLRRYEQAFSRDLLCVVFLEDLRRNPGKVIEQVCSHLGLPPTDLESRSALPHENRATFPRWPRLDALTRAARLRAEAAGPLLTSMLTAIGRVTRPLRVYSGAPRMRPATRAELRRSFATSDAALAEWLHHRPPWIDPPEARE